MTQAPSALVALGRDSDGVLRVGVSSTGRVVEDLADASAVGAADVQSIVTRGSDEESRCARYIYGGAVVKPGDREACTSYYEQLRRAPIRTAGKTLATYVLGEQLAAGALCSSVLATNPWGYAGCQIVGHFFGESIGAWLKGALVDLGLSDCRDQGPTEAVMAVQLWESVRRAQAEGAHVFADPLAPGAMWAHAQNTASLWVNDGLENCQGAEWWVAKTLDFQNGVDLLARESQARAQAHIPERAKAIAMGEVPVPPAEPTEADLRVLEASFAVAMVENELATEGQMLRLDENIAGRPSDDASFLATPQGKSFEAKRERAEAKNAELLTDARNGTGPFAPAIPGWAWAAGAAALGALGYYFRKPIVRAARKAKKRIKRIVR